ncbi:hypothetical protein AURDEDRAFT_175706 [Auricularia subglabra TFB-10046 SS5]|nr:hypothetical protein AURDEDRAFT_175706 [Auricularia subglabra TFB-10046 SS5]
MSDERSSSSTTTAAILAPGPARVCVVPTAPLLCHAAPAPRWRPLALFNSTDESAAADVRHGELQLDPYTAVAPEPPMLDGASCVRRVWQRRTRPFAGAGPP